MKVALITEHVSVQPDPTAGAYPPEPASRVLSLGAALTGLGHQVMVYARKGPARQPAVTAGGVGIEVIDAGPPDALTADRLLPHVGTFARRLEGIWLQSPPDVVHAHDWIGGLAAPSAARGLGIPVAQTF